MADSFNKKEKVKKRLKKKKEKAEKRAARKAAKLEAGKKSFEDMISYVGADGNLTKVPPNPEDRVEVDINDIIVGVPKKEDYPEEIEEKVRKGHVKFFNSEKGFGFIVDAKNQSEIFVHVNNVTGEIAEGMQVTFEVEKGLKGPNAIKVTQLES